jgi:CTP-dependent riboflavin kinase
MKVLTGKIISEMGEAAEWMGKLESYYSFKTGIKLFPTTVQVQIDEPLSLSSMKEGEANTFPCFINGAEGVVVAYNELGIIQISPSIEIQDLRLNNGEIVEVAIPIIESIQS